MKASLMRKFSLWWRHQFQRSDMATINVGIQSNGMIAVDMCGEKKKDTWSFHELTINEAKFLQEELTNALQRATARFPDGTPAESVKERDKDEEDEDEDEDEE